MKRSTLWIAVIFTSLTTPNIASANQTANKTINLSGNTLLIKNRFGTTLMHYYSDGSYQQFSAANVKSSGSWRSEKDKVCATVQSSDTVKPQREHCISLAGMQIGSIWNGNIEDRNGPITYQLLKGHPTFETLKR